MVLKAKEIRGMTADERHKKLRELREELMHERGMSAMGGICRPQEKSASYGCRLRGF